MGIMLPMSRMVMTSNWEDIKKTRTEPGIFNLFLIGGKWDITRIINHEKKIGLRVGCNSLNIENKVFEMKLPKLSQIKISWDFGNNPSLIILLEDDSFEDLFIKFVEIIIDTIKDSKDEESLIKTAIRECFKWSLFLMTDKERKLKLNNQKGLIAELLFLQNIFKYLDFQSALNCWTGPDKFTKDFILNNIGFEIKSLQTGNRNKVSISSYDQLDLLGLDKLFLVTYRLSAGTKDNELSFSLADLINNIRRELDIDQNSKFIFENKLILSGFSDLDDYSDCLFIKSDNCTFYSISNNFPCITSANISTKSIIRLNYDLDISTLEKHKVDEFKVMNKIEKNENKLDLMFEPLESKINKGETHFVEFKQSLSLDFRKIDNKDYSPKREKYLEDVCIKTIVGFFNAERRIIYWNKGRSIEIFGIEKELEILYKSSTDQILRSLKGLFKNNIGLQFFDLINFQIVLLENKKIIHVLCKKANEPIFMKGIDFYARFSNSTEKLEGKGLQEYINRRFKN